LVFGFDVTVRLGEFFVEGTDVTDVVHGFALLDAYSVLSQVEAKATSVEVLEVSLLEDVQLAQQKEAMSGNKDLDIRGCFNRLRSLP